MKNRSQILFLIPLVLGTLSVSSAQIPNAGFEDWTLGAPSSWMTSNIPSAAVPVTQSTDAHSGSSALQGSVVSYLTAAYPPVATTSFGISSRYGSLTGYYKYSPIGGDSLDVAVIFYRQGTGIATGVFSAGAAVSSYTLFTVPIDYTNANAPDSAWIEATITPSAAMTHVGSTFKLDDLSFGTATDVQAPLSTQPAIFRLDQNYPNPFNPTTLITYEIPSNGRVRLEIYDMLGRSLATLVNGEQPAGTFTVPFDGSKYASGMYLYRISVAAQDGRSFSRTNSMVLIK